MKSIFASAVLFCAGSWVCGCHEAPTTRPTRLILPGAGAAVDDERAWRWSDPDPGPPPQIPEPERYPPVPAGHARVILGRPELEVDCTVVFQDAGGAVTSVLGPIEGGAIEGPIQAAGMVTLACGSELLTWTDVSPGDSLQLRLPGVPRDEPLGRVTVHLPEPPVGTERVQVSLGASGCARVRIPPSARVAYLDPVRACAGQVPRSEVWALAWISYDVVGYAHARITLPGHVNVTLPEYRAEWGAIEFDLVDLVDFASGTEFSIRRVDVAGTVGQPQRGGLHAAGARRVVPPELHVGRGQVSDETIRFM